MLKLEAVQEYQINQIITYLANFEGEIRGEKFWRNRLKSWWEDNPCYNSNFCRGWVLLDSKKSIVGFIGNIPRTFLVKGEPIIVNNASTWRVVDQYRSKAILLFQELINSSRSTILFNTTPTNKVEKMLNILNFNRLVKNLNGLSTSEFLSKIKLKYTITEKKENIYSPTFENEISMYLDGKWYSLIAINKQHNSIAESLDPSILSKNILNPILNIVDERIDKNISFLDGKIPLLEIKEKIDNEEYSAGFILKPISINAIKKVADNNEVMPPKSTYVEPKLRSGLTIYTIE